jgi:hypothetical protein
MRNGQYYKEVRGENTSVWVVISYTQRVINIKHISGPTYHYSSDGAGVFPFLVSYFTSQFEPMSTLEPVRHINKHTL